MVHAGEMTIDVPKVVLPGVGFSVSAVGLEPGEIGLFVNGSRVAMAAGESLHASGIVVENNNDGAVNIELQQNGASVFSASVPVIPGWASLLPPLIAILLAFLVRAVIPALFVGLLVGAWAANGMTWPGAVSGLFETVTVYVLNTSINRDHMSIMLFTFIMGGMIGIISKNGGMVGIVERIMPVASNAKRGQGVIASLGMVIFFDDYANTMIVGNATRPMSDKLRISREKLAYLVDSTAAPVSTVAIITTWIGFQLGLIGTAIDKIEGITESPYVLFLNSIPYSFYPFLAVFFVWVVILSGKDFGPMLTAEIRARTTGDVSSLSTEAGSDPASTEFEQKKGVPSRAINAVLPILTMIFSVIGGLYVSGEGDTITDIIGSADPYIVLIWASLLGCLMAAVLTLAQRLLSLDELVEAWLVGARFMLTGLVLLVMAWAVADVADVLQTAPYLISVLGSSLSPYSLPAVVFILAAATAFASGSSWGVMAILMPLVIPLCWAVLQANGIADAGHMHILYSCIACVLTGAVWADHCSPISDTTVLSSLATGCDHMDHVRTQIPYALLGGVVALLVGVLPAGYGLPWWMLMPTCAVVLVAVHRFLGKPSEPPATEAAS